MPSWSDVDGDEVGFGEGAVGEVAAEGAEGDVDEFEGGGGSGGAQHGFDGGGGVGWWGGDGSGAAESDLGLAEAVEEGDDAGGEEAESGELAEGREQARAVRVLIDQAVRIAQVSVAGVAVAGGGRDGGDGGRRCRLWCTSVPGARHLLGRWVLESIRHTGPWCVGRVGRFD